MKLQRLQMFERVIAKDQSVLNLNCRIEIYRNQEETWVDPSGEGVVNAGLIDRLERTLVLNQQWRPKNSKHAYFPIGDLRAVVVSEFAAPARKNTRVRLQAALDQCLSNALNEYEATHDSLTGLANRSAFESFAVECVRKKLITAKESSDQKGNVSGNDCLVLMVADIDHFKQVNDSYGHYYGDIVLKCFSRRLENFATDFRNENKSGVQIMCVRPGGEEFIVALYGNIPLNDETIIAEKFRQTISEHPMPSEGEWAETNEEQEIDNIDLPHITERRITISIGLSNFRSVAGAGNEASTVATLVTQADIALYRSKAGGRNKVVRFGDILKNHGQILEHDEDANVVIIDMGRQVGILLGQEFHVYHPRFVGNRPFIFSDGRTKKRMGTYPRVSCGLVEVFDVQSEISFCKVVKKSLESYFFAGSSLEAVPVGTITHLVDGGGLRDTHGEIPIASLKQIESAIRDCLSNQKTVFTCVFSILDTNILIEQKGIAYVNKFLAVLYECMRSEFPETSTIGQPSENQICVVTASTPNEFIQFIDNIRRHVQERGFLSPTIGVGAYEGVALAEPIGEEGANNFDPLFALEYAIYAAYGFDDSRDYKVTWFDEGIARDVIHRSREEGLYDKARKDYQKFIEFGIRDAGVDNQYGVTAIEASDFEEALEPLRKAVRLAPKDGIIHANLGAVLYYLDERAEAATVFELARSLRPDYEWGSYYIVPMAVCAGERYRENPDPASLSDVVAQLKSGISIANSESDFVLKYRLLGVLREIQGNNDS